MEKCPKAKTKISNSQFPIFNQFSMINVQKALQKVFPSLEIEK